MGAPIPEIEAAVEDATAAALLDSLKTISAGERRKHAIVLNYWLSIRGDKQFPPIRDLDPLEISDAGPVSLLLEMVGGGEDGVIRHVGQAIKGGIDVEKVGDAPNPSLLSCVASRLPVVAACREAFAFEDEFPGEQGKTRCWVTLLPFSATGTWIDYVYGFVSLDPMHGAEQPTVAADPVVAVVEEGIEASDESEQPPIPDCIKPQSAEPFAVPSGALDDDADAQEEAEAASREPRSSHGRPGFSAKFFESLANVGGFYGKNVAAEPTLPPLSETDDVEEAQPVIQKAVEEETVEANEPVADEPTSEGPAAEEICPEPEAETEFEPVAEEPPISPPSPSSEGNLNSKLTDVRAKADEARQAKLRANSALYEGLSAAYDFALDAEDSPEEYLKLVEAQGLKIQLRSPMKPVVKLAFDGMCDDATIKQLEAILAWAFDQELPRGTLADRIESEGGIGPILGSHAKAA
jgi:hypothetical protein